MNDCSNCPLYKQITSYGIEWIKCNNKCVKKEDKDNDR